MNYIRNLIFVAVAASMLCTTTAFAQTRYTLTLNKQFIDTLQNSGSLKSEVPASNRKKIAFVEIRYDETKSNDHVNLDVAIRRQGDDAIIVLDDETIAKIKGQPIRIAVQDNGFSRVLLKYDTPAISPQQSSVISEETVFIRLSDVNSLAGELDNLETVKLECKFGSISIPMDQIAGIRLHTDADDSAVVVLNNGDVITGVPELSLMKLTTDWGKAEVEPDSIESITTTQGGKFSRQNTDFGSRWTLKTGNSLAPGM